MSYDEEDGFEEGFKAYGYDEEDEFKEDGDEYDLEDENPEHDG